MARGLIVGFFIVQIVALLSLVAGKGIFNKVPQPNDDLCVLQSSDKTVCVEWKYPLPSACSAFVQCSASCLATTRWCPKLAGVWQYFSDASQSCVSPDTLNCADIPPPVSRATGTPAPTPAVTIPPSATVSTPLPLLHVASDQYRATADTTFSVTRSADLPSAVDVIDFDSTAFDGQTAFDLTTDTFTPVTSGLYWLHWTVGMPHFTVPTNVTLHGLPTRISSLYRNPAHYGDTNSRTELVELEAGDRLTLSSTDTLRSNPTGVEISFSGFHLQSTMNPVVAFHGAMTGTTSGSLTWDTVVVDTHGGFVVNYYYTIPVGGIWYVTLRCSDNPTLSSFSSTHLFIAETYRAEDHYYINHWHSDGIDTYSMSVIMNIPTGYNLGAVNIQGSIYGDADHPTAMLGFLYSPIDTAQAVAWYVAISNDMIGPLDPLPFGNILQNVGSAWQVDRHVFVAPLSGLYYITLSAMKKDSAEAEMELLLNEAKHATLYFPNTGYPPTRSRDIILRLIAGDELKIRLPADNGLLHCGSGFVCTTFGGFRLSA